VLVKAAYLLHVVYNLDGIAKKIDFFFYNFLMRGPISIIFGHVGIDNKNRLSFKFLRTWTWLDRLV